jgi:hypothetical protein
MATKDDARRSALSGGNRSHLIGQSSRSVPTDGEPLNYQRHTDGQAFLVRWRHPTVESATRLGVEMEQYHERVGEPLFMGVIIGPDCVAPDPATRDALLRGHDRVYELCSCVRLVFIGGSLRQVMMRRVVTAITIATGMRGKGIAVDRSVAALTRTAERMIGADAAQLLRRLEVAGLLHASEFTAAELELRP